MVNCLAINCVAMICLMLAQSALAASPFRTAWPVDGMARAPNENIRLIDNDKNVVTTISKSKILSIRESLSKIDRTVGMTSEFWLVQLTDDNPNAFSTRNNGKNFVFLSLSMIDLLGDDIDSYAALFGHEIAHNVKNHSEQSQTRKGFLQGISLIASILFSAKTGVNFGSITDLGANLIDASFSRDQEREADQLGFSYLVESGFDPKGAITLHQKLIAASRVSHLPFLSTHPSGDERIATIQKMIAALPSPSETKSRIATVTPNQPASETGVEDKFQRGLSDSEGANFYLTVNSLRSGEDTCKPTRQLTPFTRKPALEHVAQGLSRGQTFLDSFKASGYRTSAAISINIAGNAISEKAGELLGKKHCEQMLNETFTDIGIYQDTGRLYIVLAAPFIPQVSLSQEAASQRMLELVNDARKESRICGNKKFDATSALRRNSILENVALQHSKDMAQHNYFSNNGHDDSKPAQRVERGGYPNRATAENIAAGHTTPEDAIAGFIKNPSLCANLMNPSFTEMGVAYALERNSDYGVYWTQVFGTPQ